MYSGLDELKNVLAKSSRITVLTGAGVSAECGIPVFRGKDGMWNNYKPEDLASLAAFKRSPELVWEFYNWRRKIIKNTKPGVSHKAIAKMGDSWDDFALITQNVDGLHQLAGNKDTTCLHGCIWKISCMSCNYSREDRDDLHGVPKCPECGDNLRPAVVWFGEPLDSQLLDTSINAAISSEVFIAVGTSLLVQPAASLAMLAKQSGAVAVEINLQKTFYSKHMDYVLCAKAQDVLPELAF